MKAFDITRPEVAAGAVGVANRAFVRMGLLVPPRTSPARPGISLPRMPTTSSCPHH